MRGYSEAAWERVANVHKAILRAEIRAAEILRISDRKMRRQNPSPASEQRSNSSISSRKTPGFSYLTCEAVSL